jgi:GNAT superfamily N-acetyltransferase
MPTFRKAQPKDIDFIIEAILESERSGTDILSWSRILSISEIQTAELVRNILEEEIEGQEWNLPSFYIAESDSRPAAALSAWIESQNGMASGLLKAQAISWLLPQSWKAAEAKLRQVSAVQIPRLAGALQLENIYTHPDFRGQRLAGQLITFVIQEKLQTHPELTKAEIQLMGENTRALNSYTQCGFLKRAESAVSDASVLNLLPGTFRISLQSDLGNGNHRNQGETPHHI